jgi:predicted permease
MRWHRDCPKTSRTKIVRTLIQDLRYGARVLLRSPGFTLVAVLTLAVGIAANTAIFSWIDGILVRPIPGSAQGGELMSFETVTPNGEFVTTSYPDYRDYRDHLRLLSGLAVSNPAPLSVGEQDHAERIWGELVSGNYFAVLGVKPIAGRFFSPDEYGDKLGGYPVAVISDSLWKRNYHADPSVLGSTIRVNRQQLTIIGVAPPEFRGSIPGLGFEIWTPVVMASQLNLLPDWWLRDRKARNFIALARLKPGVTVGQARGEAASVAHELAYAHAYENGGMSATLLPVWKGHFGAQGMLLEPLRILMAVCGVVLLVVCANVANLLLARATARQKEFSVRMALGASRVRMVRQLLTESLLLAILGALAGIPLALWIGRWLGYLLPPSGLPLALDITLNSDILAFILLACLVVCLASGLAPAISTARTSLNDSLKEGSRTGASGAGAQRLRGLLVISEVALALVALIAAGLFTRSFQLAARIQPGFDPHRVLIAHLGFSSAEYTATERLRFSNRLRQHLESQPGIAGVTYADDIPLGFGKGSWEDLKIEGYVPGPAENLKIYRNAVAPGYFDLMRIPLIDGRDFTEQDDDKHRLVVIVNQTFSKRFFPGRNPIGHKVYGWGDWFTIIGVAKDSKYFEPNEAALPFFYAPVRQVYRVERYVCLFVRAAGNPNDAVGLLRSEVRSMDPNVGVFDAAPLEEYIGGSLYPEKIAAILMAVLGVVALTLAAMGLYSVMAYSVSQRTSELGIRMALGAQMGDVVAMVVRQAMRLTFAGLAIGFAASLALMRLAADLLVGVSASDPMIFGGASLFLAAVASAASYLPALRATRIDPLIALRYQ